MLPLDYVLAVALLSCPAEKDSELTLTFSYLMPTLQQVGGTLELLDARESKYVLMRAGDFIADIDLLRRRYRELAQAPSLWNVQRFPPREVVCEMLAFNRAYHKNLTARRDALGNHDDLDQSLAEADQLYRVWDLVRDARSECYYVSVRRAALLSLKQALGEANFARGVLPPHVPLWRFRERD